MMVNAKISMELSTNSMTVYCRTIEYTPSIEQVVIRSDARSLLMGLIFGLIIGLAGLISGMICILSGYQIAGGLLSGGTIVSLVGTFVYGSKSCKDERATKKQ